MAKNRNEWLWEPRIVIRGTPAEIAAYRERFSNFCNTKNMGSSTLAGFLFLLGLGQAEQEPTALATLKYTSTPVALRVAEISKEEQTVEQLRHIFENDYPNDLDAFMSQCAAWQVPTHLVTKVTNSYVLEITSWHSQAASWLKNTALADGQPHTTAEIRELAVVTGVITDSQADWDKMRQAAHRAGFTSPQKGIWQLLL